jgi:hypothetical protein
MSNVTILMGGVFFLIFIFMMTAGVNTTMVQVHSIKNPLCVATNTNIAALGTPLGGNSTVQCDILHVLDDPLLRPINTALCWFGVFVQGVINIIIAIVNIIYMVISYASNILGLLFSPCSIFAENPTLYALIFIPLIAGVIYIVAQAIKPTGGG